METNNSYTWNCGKKDGELSEKLTSKRRRTTATVTIGRRALCRAAGKNSFFLLSFRSLSFFSVSVIHIIVNKSLASFNPTNIPSFADDTKTKLN